MSHIHKPEHRHGLIKGAEPVLPADCEREQAMLPRPRRSGIQQRAIPTFDQPAPNPLEVTVAASSANPGNICVARCTNSWTAL
jgi:hypothetical protein